MLSSLKKLARDLIGGEDTPSIAQPGSVTSDLSPVDRRVLMIVHDPILTSRNNRRLTEVFGWNDPESLTAGYIADLREVSGGFLNYTVVDRIDANEFPLKRDGFRYDEGSFL